MVHGDLSIIDNDPKSAIDFFQGGCCVPWWLKINPWDSEFRQYAYGQTKSADR